MWAVLALSLRTEGSSGRVARAGRSVEFAFSLNFWSELTVSTVLFSTRLHSMRSRIERQLTSSTLLAIPIVTAAKSPMVLTSTSILSRHLSRRAMPRCSVSEHSLNPKRWENSPRIAFLRSLTLKNRGSWGVSVWNTHFVIPAFVRHGFCLRRRWVVEDELWAWNGRRRRAKCFVHL